jgi:acetate kinase
MNDGYEIWRYGFHGISHECITLLTSISPELLIRLRDFYFAVICHFRLNGFTLFIIGGSQWQSIDTTIGLHP